jgi:hypothetical protein
MPARTRVRLTIKINSKNSLYSHRHFTKHLVNAFRKSPRESNSNLKTSSLLLPLLRAIPASHVQTIDTIKKLKVDERLGLTLLVLLAPRSLLEQSSWSSAKDTNPKRKIAATEPSIKRSELDQMGRRNR